MEIGIKDMITIIFCASFIVLCFANMSLMLLGYYYQCKAARRFEKLSKKGAKK